MTTLTIPKKSLPKDDLVIIGQKNYKKFLEWVRWKEELDQDLKHSLQQTKQGKIFGPFNSGEELVDALRR